MNILFVTFYFPPEVGAPQRRISEYAAALTKRGHRVSILTGFPNYPRGELIPPYRRRLYLRETLDGIEVLRVFHFLGSRQGKLGRALSEGSFALSASVAALLEAVPDVVIVESPSLLSCWAGVLLKRMRKSILVLHVSDLFPEGAAAVDMLARGKLFAVLKRMANFFYREADAIITVTTGLKDAILADGIPSQKIRFIPNGVADAHVRPRAESVANGKFRAVYAGNLGRAYNLSSVIEAAQRLEGKGFEFEFIGDGIDRPAAEKQAQALSNVRFLGGMPVALMFERLYQADAMVIPLSGKEALEAVVPSKMADAMAASLPVILAARKGELVDIVREAGCGLVVEPENPQALAEALQYLQQNRGGALQMGQRGQAFVRETRTRSILVEKFEQMLLELAKKKEISA
ncbi:MAG: glycosyltransferase family 4 protein [candidate division Zixibacteria bacterium]|nr:glycosyltransferase family 4 protein [candidate division Zixibacteria bacterium]